jgi:hypothetical protein
MEPVRKRLKTADRLVVGGALALLVSMFAFDWYGVGVGRPVVGALAAVLRGEHTGWQAFTNSRWVWLLTIVVALAAELAVARGRPLESRRFRAGELVMLLGATSTVLIVYRIVHHPSAAAHFGGPRVSVHLDFGIWVALAGALAITLGGLLQTQGSAGLARAAGLLAARARPALQAARALPLGLSGLLHSARASRKTAPSGDASRPPRERGTGAEQPPPSDGAGEFTGLTVADRRPGGSP